MQRWFHTYCWGEVLVLVPRRPPKTRNTVPLGWCRTVKVAATLLFAVSVDRHIKKLNNLCIWSYLSSENIFIPNSLPSHPNRRIHKFMEIGWKERACNLFWDIFGGCECLLWLFLEDEFSNLTGHVCCHALVALLLYYNKRKTKWNDLQISQIRIWWQQCV